MRAIRGLTAAGLLLLGTGVAEAQATRGFKDSWFWGVKGGLLNYQVVDAGVSRAPIAVLGGADWLITRTTGGLYLSIDYSLLSADSLFVNDSLSPLDSLPRVVGINGLRRFTIAGVLFPLQTYRFHPYIGFGFSLGHIGRVDPQIKAGDATLYRNATQANLVESTISFFRSSGTPLLLAGVQMKLPLASAFVQFTASPAADNFFLYTGSNFRTSLEAGLRYNAGNSIERTR